MEILYFAEIKDVLNRRKDEFHFDYEITVSYLREYLYKTYPNIQGKEFQIAVNEEFVKPTDIIKPNDVVALIPPVSGG
ncbi:molybdopterin converting factor subunit 1 [Staphylococcus massiliensis]|uniref:Molybdopterin synthase sulfur carrier subunit n=1 Tax=Staphylococcus massiliensis S46 TaxID=1229783 RepID=K9B5C3_9STAP|nr:molybdopterin converting factor subunit 1 [Staphylococcus massiliensis]EKU48945.1 molybdopterin synthase small subunit [Staphylococcus massiliensis S46]MCG3399385.1 molybdopterin converting factor subunit 1 [Staphylococcus massiliensis]MCG3402514.1 molybdopterin converting factor subunit 1 [Staphylococcus massiliensis]MCG3411521.1 molybdopterin converting factor subunit 1 [Staphylococcus massiliensis]PNZ98773.1 molybdopterin converting factor subunit 1 [Staphylococcus massiliensis CCUG 5592